MNAISARKVSIVHIYINDEARMTNKKEKLESRTAKRETRQGHASGFFSFVFRLSRFSCVSSFIIRISSFLLLS